MFVNKTEQVSQRESLPGFNKKRLARFAPFRVSQQLNKLYHNLRALFVKAVTRRRVGPFADISVGGKPYQLAGWY
ncbi:MAG: hypothetical protein ACK5U7_05090, partial [Bacteroidota bacterium]